MAAANKTQRKEIEGLTTHDKDPFLNITVVAKALGRHQTTVGRWVADGAIKSVLMPNGLRKIRRSVLVAWLEQTEFSTEEVLERVEALEE